MPYIGKQLVRGQNRELDDISGSFNGSNTVFNLTVAGDSITPGSALQLFISVGGVLQNPNTDFTVAGNQITFSTAPGSGLSFFGILQGDAVDFNTPADGSVTTAKLGSNLTINVADGTAGTPSIQFNGSGTDTGFYSPTTDEIGASVAGGEALRIDSSGRLLVGTSTSVANLYRANTASIAPTIQLENVTNSYSTGFSSLNYSASGFAPVVTLGLSKSNTQGTNTVVASGDELGYLQFVGADGTNFRTAAWIKGEVDGTPGLADMPGRLVFSTTADSASSPTERMRLSSTGALGVGTGGIANINSGYGVVAGPPTGGSGGIFAISNQNVLGTTGSGGYIVARGIAGGSGSVVIDTGISVNASIGNSLLILASRNTGAGTLTDSALYFVQFYQSGNNAPAVTFVAGDSNFVSFSVTGSNTLGVNGNLGNWSLGAIMSNTV